MERVIISTKRTIAEDSVAAQAKDIDENHGKRGFAALPDHCGNQPPPKALFRAAKPAWQSTVSRFAKPWGRAARILLRHPSGMHRKAGFPERLQTNRLLHSTAYLPPRRYMSVMAAK